MNINIYTIPINDIFSKVDGCPLCRMEKILEEKATEYITESAMMEPGIRIETNRLGFCNIHSENLLKKQKVLAVGLMLESRLKYIKKEIFDNNSESFYFSEKNNKINPLMSSCYICEKIDFSLSQMYSNIVKIWTSDEKFRELFISQEYLCLSHYNELMLSAAKKMKKNHKSLYEEATKLASKHLDMLLEEQKHFNKMFDCIYCEENKDDWKNTKTASRRIVDYFKKST